MLVRRSRGTGGAWRDGGRTPGRGGRATRPHAGRCAGTSGRWPGRCSAGVQSHECTPAPEHLICSDGTANTFGQRVSNIARLIQLVQLNDPVQQLAFHDQGIGTDSRLVETVEAYKAAPGVDRKALTILPGPYGRSRLLAKAYEARRADLRLSDEGRAWIGLPDPEAVVHESLTRGWCISENGPRWELDNQYPKPKRFFKCGGQGTAARCSSRVVARYSSTRPSAPATASRPSMCSRSPLRTGHARGEAKPVKWAVPPRG